MANIVLRGTVVAVKDQDKNGNAVFDFVDREKVPAVDIEIDQPEFAALQKARGMEYWPPRVRFPLSRLGDLEPQVGQQVVCMAITDAYTKNGDTFVNLKGRKLEVVK